MSWKKRKHRKTLRMQLFQRQEIWTLTPQGWLIAIALMTFAIAFFIAHIQPFLAVTSPIQTADTLVVEGWIPHSDLKQAFAESQRGSYRHIIVTGGPINKDFHQTGYDDFAELAAAKLQNMGLKSEKIIAVPSPDVVKDRTYESAINLRHWLEDSNLNIKSINLFTHDTHARRSWIMYNKALVPYLQVGIIASKPQHYNPQRWWESSTGVRTIINEGLAYIYAQFFF
ncbi:MAG: ElyC/SanA/YdcF family protein [Nostocaceae cyanobacterium]|nr:ElyC/SanA/YdcF family protein [Nostocaceae cyanobacterium]